METTLVKSACGEEGGCLTIQLEGATLPADVKTPRQLFSTKQNLLIRKAEISKPWVPTTSGVENEEDYIAKD
ncbi:hypothetical protein ECG_07746 [Echinococcus granulosus]|uniref:Uncharacterized protein n=1 Tax=Echinococcus granulosus TaxID=6210 RepID=A0A068WQI9_ECHGR|nr:hypothetical protein ECG_07746 [Echinococcus granulosus]CDS22376.1 hypothetical protein EgrG_002030700 [Echinococcus granulosus]